MPPKRKHNNVDVDEDEEGEGEDDVKTIRIVSPSTEKREQFMCELQGVPIKSRQCSLFSLLKLQTLPTFFLGHPVCSSVLKSAASLVRHKKRHQESRLESDDKYMCTDCVRYYISDLIRNYPFSVSPLFQAVALKT